MPTGQRTKALFFLVPSGDETALPAFCTDNKYDCNFVLPLYADDSGDDLKNGKFSVLIMPPEWTSAIVFVLQKYVGSAWVDQATITDDTYGEYYAQGDIEAKPLYSGVVIYGSLLLAALGEGDYRIETTQTNPLGEHVSYSRTFCLQEWNCRLDNLVRLEWYCNAKFGDIDNDKASLDFKGVNWYFQLMIPQSFFGYPTSEYEEETIQYTNGQFEKVKSIQTEKYTLKLGSIPAWLHNVIKTLAMQNDSLIITDYSSNNPQEIIQKSVRISSGYEPRYKTGHKCAPVTLELTPVWNRLELNNC